MCFVSFKGGKPEFLVSGSDDFTLFLWQPSESKKQIARMTGKNSFIIIDKFLNMCVCVCVYTYTKNIWFIC